MKRILLSLCIFTFPLMAVNHGAILLRATDGYKLSINGLEHKVKSYDVDSRLKSCNKKQLHHQSQQQMVLHH